MCSVFFNTNTNERATIFSEEHLKDALDDAISHGARHGLMIHEITIDSKSIFKDIKEFPEEHLGPWARKNKIFR